MITNLKEWKNKVNETCTYEGNYMVKANLEKIHKQILELLSLDEEILADLEPWAIDHLTTSADDIDEVYNYLILNEGLWDNIRKKRKRLRVDKIGSKGSTFKNKKEFLKVAKQINSKD